MLWPLVLPFQITAVTCLVVIMALAIRSSRRGGKVGKTIAISSLLCLVLFVPACTGSMFIIDQFRFGQIEFAHYADIQNPRARRYLPPVAAQVTMDIQSSGYHATYQISQQELEQYVDGMWQRYQQVTGRSRKQDDNQGREMQLERYKDYFNQLEWDVTQAAKVYSSPIESDGGGASYYFVPETGMVYQRTNYW